MLRETMLQIFSSCLVDVMKRVWSSASSSDDLLWPRNGLHLLLPSLVYSCHVTSHLFHGRSSQQAPYCCQRPFILLCISHIRKCVSHHHRVHQWYCSLLGRGYTSADGQDVISHSSNSRGAQKHKTPL